MISIFTSIVLFNRCDLHKGLNRVDNIWGLTLLSLQFFRVYHFVKIVDFGPFSVAKPRNIRVQKKKIIETIVSKNPNKQWNNSFHLQIDKYPTPHVEKHWSKTTSVLNNRCRASWFAPRIVLHWPHQQYPHFSQTECWTQIRSEHGIFRFRNSFRYHPWRLYMNRFAKQSCAWQIYFYNSSDLRGCKYRVLNR